MCADAGVPLTFTKLSSSHLMEVAAGGSVTFAASQSGGFLFPDFLPAYDATATLVELVAMSVSTGQTLSEAGFGRFPRSTSPTSQWSRRGSRRAW